MTDDPSPIHIEARAIGLPLVTEDAIEVRPKRARKTEEKPDLELEAQPEQSDEAPIPKIEVQAATPEIVASENWAPSPVRVTHAIANVIRDMDGVGKDQYNSQGWMFRGIEDITAALKVQLGKHGVCLIPKTKKITYEDVIVGGKPWREATVTMTWRAYGPLGDSVVIGPVVGKGRDNSDKDVSKAMSMAFKYALLHTFCIADPDQQDADREKHETDSYGGKAGRGKSTKQTRTKADDSRQEACAEAKAAITLISTLPTAEKEAVRTWVKAQDFGHYSRWSPEQATLITEHILDMTAATEEPEQADTGMADGERIEQGAPSNDE